MGVPRRLLPRFLALLAWMTVSLITMAAVAALPGPLVSESRMG
jgi:hypothetical protein